MAFTRRKFIKAAGSGLGASALAFPAIVRAQSEPIRIGLMTVKTGPLASGGNDMERALMLFLRERNNTLAGYCAKTLKYKRMAVIADDIAYGHEMCAGFQRVFEDAGGKIVQKMFPPLTVPDYSTYLAQLKTNIDGIFLGFAGSNGFRWYKQFNEYGLKGKINVVGGMTAFDEAVLRNMGDEAIGIITACWYSAELDNPINKKFAAAFRNEWKYDPGFYAAATYVEGAVLEAALEAVKGKIEDKAAFMKALRGIHADTERGPVAFDEYGNIVGNV